MGIRDFGSTWRVLAAGVLALAMGAAFAQPPEDLDKERAEARAQSGDVLARLYAAQPSAKASIAASAGYATFRNLGIKIGVAGTGKGKGLAVRGRDKRETFMRFVEVQAGLGVGIKKYDLVFVFENEKALEDFITKGWAYSGQTSLVAKHGSKGDSFDGAAAISPGIWLYQLTSSGLAAEITLKSSKYYQDKDLNAAPAAKK